MMIRGIATTLIAGVMVGMVALMFVGAPVGNWLCQQQVQGADVRWSRFAGCQVRTASGVWVPLQNYRAIAE